MRESNIDDLVVAAIAAWNGAPPPNIAEWREKSPSSWEAWRRVVTAVTAGPEIIGLMQAAEQAQGLLIWQTMQTVSKRDLLQTASKVERAIEALIGMKRPRCPACACLAVVGNDGAWVPAHVGSCGAAQGIEAGTAETAQQAPCEAREPGRPKADAP